MPKEPILEVDSLTKDYGPVRALDGVSFAVSEGEMFGLLGPNGAGKTTLLSIISCLIRSTSGRATLFGKELSPTNRLIRQQIGIVPQESALYDDLSARENLSFFGKLYGMGGATLRKRIDDVLQAIGLADRATRRVGTFSGGMKRRLNLGVAIIHEPRLLLLDEPTTGVDPQSRNHLFDEIRRINQAGMAIIYTSHYVSEVESLCNRVAIMDHGRLIACDELDVLMQHLQSVIRFRVTPDPAPLISRLVTRDDIVVRTTEDNAVEIECNEIKTTLIQVMTLLNELQLGLVSLETEEPSLEHVFLHLTGKALRD